MAIVIGSPTTTPLPAGGVLVAGLSNLSSNYQTGGSLFNISNYIMTNDSPVVVFNPPTSNTMLVVTHRGYASNGNAVVCWTNGAQVDAEVDLSALQVRWFATGRSR